MPCWTGDLKLLQAELRMDLWIYCIEETVSSDIKTCDTYLSVVSGY